MRERPQQEFLIATMYGQLDCYGNFQTTVIPWNRDITLTLGERTRRIKPHNKNRQDALFTFNLFQ